MHCTNQGDARPATTTDDEWDEGWWGGMRNGAPNTRGARRQEQHQSRCSGAPEGRLRRARRHEPGGDPDVPRRSDVAPHGRASVVYYRIEFVCLTPSLQPPTPNPLLAPPHQGCIRREQT